MYFLPTFIFYNKINKIKEVYSLPYLKKKKKKKKFQKFRMKYSKDTVILFENPNPE